MRFWILTVALAALSAPAFANDGPSYEETVEFIQARLATSFPYSNRIAYRRIDFPERCVVQRTDGRAHDVNQFVRRVDLKEVDPSAVKVADWTGGEIDLVIRDNRKVVETTHYFRDKSYFSSYRSDGYKCGKTECVRQVQNNTFWIDIRLVKPPRDRNEGKLVKALAHLARLCGGKDELF